MTAERVSLVTPLAGRDGGVAIHVMESADALTAAGHQVTIVCARADAGAQLSAIEVPEIAEPGSAQAGACLERALRASRPDIVQIHDLADPQIVTTAQRCAPTLVSAHGYPGCTHNNHYFAPGVECHRGHGPGCLVNIAFRGCFHARNPLPVAGLYGQTSLRLAAYEMADGIVAYSNAVVRHLAENGLKARLVPLFTALARRDAPPPPKYGRRVLFVGRVVPAKGLETLLRAMARIDAGLTIVGDGWRRSAAEELATRLDITARVRFAGWMTGDALVDQYRESNVVAVPSLWPEPFGLVGIEAMALGRPVVASMTGGIRDWLYHGVTGIGVWPGRVSELVDALTRILDDPGLQATMGASGRHLVEQRFTERAHVAALSSAFAAAAEGWRPSIR
ncbi:MAG: glycosyltransferase family 4 protein [Solirubrobacteraceae bacterium]